MTWHRLETPTELASGEKATTLVGGREILICRVDDTYYALGSRCTHSAWPLVGEPLEGNVIVCTLHGARFDVRDGCPSGGPTSKPLATYAIERRDGVLYVSLSE
jgi:3-phenylpropionate/trans-cinnamate dioxygenase ferredoxin subunit